jgi:hypothetical protein
MSGARNVYCFCGQAPRCSKSFLDCTSDGQPEHVPLRLHISCSVKDAPITFAVMVFHDFSPNAACACLTGNGSRALVFPYHIPDWHGESPLHLAAFADAWLRPCATQDVRCARDCDHVQAIESLDGCKRPRCVYLCRILCTRHRLLLGLRTNRGPGKPKVRRPVFTIFSVGPFTVDLEQGNENSS